MHPPTDMARDALRQLASLPKEERRRFHERLPFKLRPGRVPHAPSAERAAPSRKGAGAGARGSLQSADWDQVGTWEFPPEEAYQEPKPHHAVAWRVRNLKPGAGFRFFRLVQLGSGEHGTKRMHVQGFELYGLLRTGLTEWLDERVANPEGLTSEEMRLPGGEGQGGEQFRRRSTWDAKQVMERERQKEYKVLPDARRPAPGARARLAPVPSRLALEHAEAGSDRRVHTTQTR